MPRSFRDMGSHRFLAAEALNSFFNNCNQGHN
jgi:hypothetical protein